MRPRVGNVKMLAAWTEPSNLTGRLIISWKQIPISHFRGLVSYFISFQKSFRNLTWQSGSVSTCKDGWTTIERVINGSKSQNTVSVELAGLEAFSRYAFFIRGFPLTGIGVGAKAQSQVFYGMTNPANPSPPTNIEVHSKVPNTLDVRWDPPDNPNGVIHHYVLSIRHIEETKFSRDGVDVCSMQLEQKLKLYDKWQEKKELLQFGTSARSTRKRKVSFRSVTEVNFGNQVYSTKLAPSFCKETNPDIEEEADEIRNYEMCMRCETTHSIEPADLQHNSTEIQTNVSGWVFQQIIITNKTNFFFTNLKPLGLYAIKLTACQSPVPCNSHFLPGDTKQSHNWTKKGVALCKLCSVTSAFGSGIVKRNEKLDTMPIDSLVINNNTKDGTGVDISWSARTWNTPPILAYIVQLRLEASQEIYRTGCVPHIDTKLRQSALMENLASGIYSMRLQVVTLYAMTSNSSDWSKFEFKAKNTNQASFIIKIMCLVILVEVFIAGVAFFIWRRYKTSRRKRYLGSQEYLRAPELIDLPNNYHQFRPEVLLSHDQLQLNESKKLGDGHFGKVFEAYIAVRNNERIKVAAKIQNKGNHKELNRFVNEALVMQEMSCHHVVKLIGVMLEVPPFMYAMELMENRDLKTYLKKSCRNKLSDKVFIKMSAEAADGMAYLTSRHLVHRDLAARNCLLDKHLNLKIADLGLAVPPEPLGSRRLPKNMPIRWMAPESLSLNVFTSRSDVWSYGVLLWEMSTGCEVPYQDLGNGQVAANVIKNGSTLFIPTATIPSFQRVIKRCWQYNPKLRPSFIAIVKYLIQAMPTSTISSFEKVSFYHKRISKDAHLRTTEGSASGFWGRCSVEGNSEKFSGSDHNNPEVEGLESEFSPINYATLQEPQNIHPIVTTYSPHHYRKPRKKQKLQISNIKQSQTLVTPILEAAIHFPIDNLSNIRVCSTQTCLADVEICSETAHTKHTRKEPPYYCYNNCRSTNIVNAFWEIPSNLVQNQPTVFATPEPSAIPPFFFCKCSSKEPSVPHSTNLFSQEFSNSRKHFSNDFSHPIKLFSPDEFPNPTRLFSQEEFSKPNKISQCQVPYYNREEISLCSTINK